MTRQAKSTNRKRRRRPAARAEGRTARLRALARLNRVISSSLEMRGVLSGIARAAKEISRAAFVSFWLVDEAGRNLTRGAVSDERIWRSYPVETLPIEGGGVMGEVARTGRAVNVPDVFRDARIVAPQWFKAHRFSSYFGIPVVSDGSVLAVLNLNGRGPFHFGPGDRDLLHAFAAQAAVAIHNARVFTESQERRRTAEALAEVGRTLSQALDPEVVARRSMASVLGLLRVQSAVLYRLEPESGELVAAAEAKAPGATFPWAPRLVPGTGAGGAAIRGGRAVATPDCLADSRIRYSPEMRAALEQRPSRALLAAPLIVQDRMFGALVVGDGTGRVFTNQDIHLAQAFADQAAVALENARLYDEARRRQREAEALAQVARTLTETLDVADVAQRIVDSVPALFGARSSGLRLLRPDGSVETVARTGHAGAHPEPGHVLPPGIGFSHRILAEGRAVRTSNVLADPAITLNDALRSRLRASAEAAFMGAPLRAKGQIIGLLTVADREGRRFTDAEMALLQAFADQAALALENARLYEREREARSAAEASRQALSESEARFRSLIENASDLVTVLAPDGTIAYESPSIERMLGWRPEELVGKQLIDYLHPEDRERVAAGIASRIADPDAVNPPLELRVRARDGSWHVLEATSRVLKTETGAVTLVASSRDVTERRGLEEQLRQAQRMESIGRLAGGVAHDFNNLLTVIAGRSRLALGRLSSDDLVRRDVELIEKTSGRAAALTQQLLAFSRKQVLQPKVLDLNVVLSSTESMLRRLIGEDIELVTAAATGLGKVRADPGQVEQVIMNLALNARDAMPHGGRLTIETANAVLDEHAAQGQEDLRPGPYVLLRVSDTGGGMDEATRSRIFEPFFTTKEVGKGTGLGLSTVYGIIKQSGGHIAADSEPGRGSAFTLYLPQVAAPAEAAEPPQAVEDAPRGRETILLVEDEEGVRDLAREILELRGYTVLDAPGAGEAERVCREHPGPIALLVSDVVMPQMSGRDLARRLTGLRPEMRVLYMSGYTDEAIVHHGVLDPGIAFLPKPFTPADLARKVREALDGGA